MHLWPALLAIIVVVVQLVFRFEAHAETVLPDFAGLALYHEFAGIWVVLSFARVALAENR